MKLREVGVQFDRTSEEKNLLEFAFALEKYESLSFLLSCEELFGSRNFDIEGPKLKIASQMINRNHVESIRAICFNK